MSLGFFRTFSSPARKVTLNEEKSDLSLLWESHCCSPMKSNNSLKSKCSTPKSKQAEVNFLNLLIAAKPQTPTKKLYTPPRHNLTLPKSPSRINNDSESLNNSEFLYSRISITTDQIFSLPEEIKQFVAYVYSPSSNRGDS